MTDQAPAPANQFIQTYVGGLGTSFNSYAENLGLPPTAAIAAASAVAEEMRGVYDATGAKRIKDALLDLNGRFDFGNDGAPRTNEYYATVFSQSLSQIVDGSLNRKPPGTVGEIIFGLRKLINPMSEDIGPANINFGSASYLLMQYLNNGSNGSDPLGLRQYLINPTEVGPVGPSQMDFARFYEDLNSLNSPTVAAVAMLNIAAGYQYLGNTYGSTFTDLAGGSIGDQQFQVGLLSAISKMGLERFKEKYPGDLPDPTTLPGGDFVSLNFFLVNRLINSGDFGSPPSDPMTGVQKASYDSDSQQATILGDSGWYLKIDAAGNVVIGTELTGIAGTMSGNQISSINTESGTLALTLASNSNVAAASLELASNGAISLLARGVDVSAAAGSQISSTASGGIVVSFPNGSAVLLNQDNSLALTGVSGQSAILDLTDVNSGNVTATVGTFTTSNGSVVTLNAGGISYSVNGSNEYSSADPNAAIMVDAGSLRVGSVALGGLPQIGQTYDINVDGTLSTAHAAFMQFVLPNGNSPSFSMISADVASLLPVANMDAGGIHAASGPIDNSLIPTIAAVNLGGIPIGQLPFTTDPTGAVANGLVIATTDGQVVMPNINNDGVFNNSPGDIVSGDWRPGNQQLEPASQDLTSTLANDFALTVGQFPTSYGNYVNDLQNETPTYLNTDPLVLDLDGNGISLSNWITNNVYFDTNVVPDPNHAGKVIADGRLHHTSWVNAGDGILVFEPGGTASPVADITQTFSQFFRGGNYTNGFAALATLAQAGATVFSRATALTDPSTGRSYFDEVMVWQDANQDGVAQPSELKTLDALGITSIGLAGSANTGESINGSAVISRASYTTASGTGQVASVDLQTDSTGDITTTANGGVIIHSYTEGTPTPATTFVAQNASGHHYALSNGTLTDQTLGVTVGTGITGVLSSTQGDTITVAANDPGTYWLGGGTGADTLTGGAGNTVFLINSQTVVHGGTGFNIAKVIDGRPITVDLAQSHLQEVIGGDGDGVFNASGTTWNVFVQGGSGNNIIIGGAAHDALSGGTGDDLIEAGPGGSVIHAGSGNDLIYGGSGATAETQPSYVNAGGADNAAFLSRLYNGGLNREIDLASYQSYKTGLDNGSMTRIQVATAIIASSEWLARYGTQSNTQFVTSVFQALVGRAPTAAELNNFVAQGLDLGEPRGQVLDVVAESGLSQAYWGAQHPGASDLIYGGPGHSTVVAGTNNTIVYDGTGPMTVIGNPNGFTVMAFHGSYADYRLTRNADGTVTVTNVGTEGDGTVTMKDVKALDFSDIHQIGATTAGMPANDHLNTGNASQVTVNSVGQYVIAAATLLANDQDWSGHALSIRELLDNNGNAIARGSSGTVNGGVAALSSDGSTITFTPTAGFNGVMSFRYHITDGAGNNGLIVSQIGTYNTAELTATVYLDTPSQPTDPLFDSESYLQAINIGGAWKDYSGNGVSVGVFDEGDNVDFTSPDLVPNAGNSFKIDGSPGIEQVGTHATLIAGIIAAARDGEGAVGVAYDATISSHALSSIFENTASNGLEPWRNYDIVNNSFQLSPPFIDDFLVTDSSGKNVYLKAFQDAVNFGRGGLGTIIVSSGGNERQSGGNTNYWNLTNSSYVITVGGINAKTDLGSLIVSGQPFSNPGATILVSAPASNIESTGVTSVNAFGQTFGADFQTSQGTSFAAPIVSGVVALMLEANPNLKYTDVQEILAYSATRVQTTDHDPFDTSIANFIYNGATNWNGGGLHTSQDYGFGEVDSTAAVRLAETWKTDSVSNTGVPLLPASNWTVAIDANSNNTYTFNIFYPIGGNQLLHHIDVQLGLTIADPSHLIVTLIAPSGVRSNLLFDPAQQNLNGAFTFGTDRDWGEVVSNNPVGTWQLQVVNTGSATGTLQLADMIFYTSNFYTTHVYTNEFGSLGDDPNNTARSTLIDTSGQGVLNAAAVSSNSVIDLRSGSTDSVIAGRSLTIAANTVLKTAYGGDGNDLIIGDNAGDTLNGGRGNDILIGGSGNDTLISGSGNDTLFGGGGRDTLTAGTGNDILIVDGSTTGQTATLIAGTGNDIFQVLSAAAAASPTAPQNLIENFKPGTDKIDLSRLSWITSFADLSFTTATFAGQSYLQVNLGHGQLLMLSGLTASQLNAGSFVFRSVQAPLLSVQPAVGGTGAAIPLTIAAILPDQGTTENLTVTISGVPNGATLSAGTHNADGSWTLTQQQLAGLTLVPGSSQGNATLSITATASAQGNASSASISATLPVFISGAATITQVGTNYYLSGANSGSSAELKYQGAPCTVGQFGTAWSPVAAAQTSNGGYYVAWANPGANQYGVWLTDSNGNQVSSVLAPTAGTSTAIESFESIFHQDLNGDGVITSPAMSRTNGSTTLVQIGTNYFIYGGGSWTELQYNGAPYTIGTFPGFSLIGAVQDGSGGYDVAWANQGQNQYGIWVIDSTATRFPHLFFPYQERTRHSRRSSRCSIRT